MASRFQGGRARGRGRVPARGAGRDREVPMKGTSGTIDELPTLHYGRSTNYEEFKRKITLYAEREYPLLASFFRTEQYFVPPPIQEGVQYELEELEPDQDPFGLRRSEIVNEISNRLKHIDKANSQKPSLFSVIWGQLSPASEQMVMQHQTWPQIAWRDNPLLLWLAIRDTHVVQAIGQGQIDRMTAREQYGRLRQGALESLVNFKERTDEAIRALEAYAVEVLPQADLATDFINRLDKARYAQFQVDLQNNAMLGNIPYPDNLTDAFNKASRFKVVVPTQKANGNNDVITQSVFITDAESNKSNRQAYKPKSDKKARPTEEKKSGGCYLCNGTDHWAKHCPLIGEFRTIVGERREVATPAIQEPTLQLNPPRNHHHHGYVTFSRDQVVLPDMLETSTSVALPSPTGIILKKTDVLLDNQATKGIFNNQELLTNLRKASITSSFTGIGGRLESNWIGDVEDLGTVSYAPTAIANILSFAEIEEKYEIEYIPQEGFLVKTDSKYYMFSKKGNLYVCDFSSQNSQMAMVQTVEENESLYTKRQVEDAKIARDLKKQLGYASDKDLIKLINSGGIINCPVTAHDVYRASRIYGYDIPSLKGKSKIKPSAIIKIEHVPRPVVSELTLHVDLMAIEGDPYLITVSTPLGLTMVTHLQGSKAEASIKQALLEQINIYAAQSFTIATILSDNEGAISKMANELLGKGIKVNFAGPGQHVPVVENKIRQCKERVRAHIHSLPYQLPSFLMKFLVLFCVSRLNMMPSASKTALPISPIELFRGRKIDYQRDLRIGFGEYVQADNPNITFRNGMQARTDGAIALLPMGNMQGSVKFYSLATKSYITRDHWKVLPMPAAAIEHMNSLASNEKKRLTQDPIFEIGEDPIVIQDADVVADTDQITIEEPPTKLTEVNSGDQFVFTPEPADEEQGVFQDTSPTIPLSVEEEQVEDVSVEVDRYNLRSKKTYGNDDKTYEYGLNIQVKKAIDQFGSHAEDAIKQELKQMIDKKVWRAISQDEGRATTKPIRSFMFLKLKYDAAGQFEKIKARIVAGGHMQDRNIYEDSELSASTVDSTSLFMVAAIAAKEHRKCYAVDVGGAYLNASIKNKTIYMIIEPTLSKYLIELEPEVYQSCERRDGSIMVVLEKPFMDVLNLPNYGTITSLRPSRISVSKSTH